MDNWVTLEWLPLTGDYNATRWLLTSNQLRNFSHSTKTACPVFAPTVSFAMQPTYFSYPTGLRAPGADWEPKNFRLSALRELASPRANSRNEKSHRKLVRDSERESGCDRISWAKDKSFSALFTSLSLPLPPRLVSSCLVSTRLHLHFIP